MASSALTLRWPCWPSSALLRQRCHERAWGASLKEWQPQLAEEHRGIGARVCGRVYHRGGHPLPLRPPRLGPGRASEARNRVMMGNSPDWRQQMKAARRQARLQAWLYRQQVRQQARAYRWQQRLYAGPLAGLGTVVMLITFAG